MTLEFDAVVVGAGHNGLATAVHLASRGWSVTVVEKASAPGGAVKTAEATLPGFRHDLYAMNLSMFAGSPFFASHRDGLLKHGLELVPSRDGFATAFPDGTWLGVSQDIETTTARIAALSAADARNWRALMDRFGREAPHIFALLGAELPSRAAMGAVWKAWRALGVAGVADIAKLVLSSPRAFLDAHFEHPKVKAMLGAWGLHLDFGPDVAGGALFPYLESCACQSFGMVFGRGGADTIIRAMTGYLRSLGGDIRLDAPVEAIEIEGGRARGVRLASGERLIARRAVVANLHPKGLAKLVAGRAGDRRPSDFAAKTAGFRAGPGTMMIHLALNGPAEWRAGADLGRFPYVHLAPDFGTMGRTYNEAMAGLLPAEPVLVVGQPTAIDPTRAPEGHHILWVQVRVLPADIRGDAAGAIQARTWDEAKEAYADRAIALLETYAPGLSAKILARAVHSPLDLERDNPNLVGGDSLSGSHQLDQNFLFRPAFGWSKHRGPADGLFMVGASTWPGAGTGAGSGFMVGKRLAGEARPAR
ncbi:phytoene desaturase family protein [Aureimonas ureilytica]|uniref:phytoene desaturase family protein n=1 Tax=Aureimonas ureilytica TaxID=401562 RepID=UPI00037B6161|nr:NAD(P)/FAD-dependent oxidoreductase [Aureimonas ureilytica]